MSDHAKKDKIIQNLKDAGCTESEILNFLANWQNGQIKNALFFLEQHRKTLLDEFHKSKSRIDCLDYLVFQIEKEQEKNNRQEAAS